MKCTTIKSNQERIFSFRFKTISEVISDLVDKIALSGRNIEQYITKQNKFRPTDQMGKTQ